MAHMQKNADPSNRRWMPRGRTECARLKASLRKRKAHNRPPSNVSQVDADPRPRKTPNDPQSPKLILPATGLHGTAPPSATNSCKRVVAGALGVQARTRAADDAGAEQYPTGRTWQITPVQAQASEARGKALIRDLGRQTAPEAAGAGGAYPPPTDQGANLPMAAWGRPNCNREAVRLPRPARRTRLSEMGPKNTPQDLVQATSPAGNSEAELCYKVGSKQVLQTLRNQADSRTMGEVMFCGGRCDELPVVAPPGLAQHTRTHRPLWCDRRLKEAERLVDTPRCRHKGAAG